MNFQKNDSTLSSQINYIISDINYDQLKDDAIVLQMQSKYNECKALYLALYNYNSKDQLVIYLLGYLLFQMRDYSEALFFLNKGAHTLDMLHFH